MKTQLIVIFVVLNNNGLIRFFLYVLGKYLSYKVTLNENQSQKQTYSNRLQKHLQIVKKSDESYQ